MRKIACYIITALVVFAKLDYVVALESGATPLFDVGWAESEGDYYWTDVPRYGMQSPLSGDPDSYKWSATLSSESNGWRKDVYENLLTGTVVNVEGLILDPYLATVKGDGRNQIHWGRGGPTLWETVEPQTTGGTVTINGTTYTCTLNNLLNEVDFVNSTINFSMGGIEQAYVSTDQTKHLAVAPIPGSSYGVVSGEETGISYGGSAWYLDSYSSATPPTWNDLVTEDWIVYYWHPTSGVKYQQNQATTYSNGAYERVWTDSGTGDTLTRSYWIYSGPGGGTIDFFGKTYNRTVIATLLEYGYLGGTEYFFKRVVEDYTTDNSGTLSYKTEKEGYTNATLFTVSGWDFVLGDFSGSSSYAISSGTGSVAMLNPRSAAVIAPAQLWVNNTLVSWVSGTLNANGYVVDTYQNGDGTLTMTLQTSNIFDFLDNTDTEFFNGQDNAWVNIQKLNAPGGDVIASGSGYLSNAFVFTSDDGGWDIQIHEPNQTAPLFITTTPHVIWVDGTAYPFAYGYQDTAGNRADIYLVSGGTLTLLGTTSSTTATVNVVFGGVLSTGTVTKGDGESFNVTGVDISVRAPGAPAGFWVGNVFYRRTAGTNDYVSFPTTGSTLSLSGTNPGSLTATGTQGASAITGTFNSTAAGVFLLTMDSASILATAAHANGSLVLGGTAPVGFPPAARLEGVNLDFLGTAVEDGAPGETAAYYGDTTTAVYETDPESPTYLVPLSTAPRRILKIRTGSGSPFAVTLGNYTTGTSQTGTYDSATHLFHITQPGSSALPVTTAVDPAEGYAMWLLAPPATLPVSFVVNGVPWWFAGATPEGVATYRGFDDDQEMILGIPNAATGARGVTLRYRKADNSLVETSGVLNSVRGSARLDDETVVVSGTPTGLPQSITPVDTPDVHTIASDLDLVGNNFSFGILQGDASLAGALFHFGDVGNTAALYQTLSRSQAQWVWRHLKGAEGEGMLNTMVLDASHKLSLYDKPSLPTQAQQAGVVLDPALGGVSTIRGVLRVRPGGDVGMGEFTTSPAGVTAP